jgi:branched-chain amino acid transport system substrate-binding protein
MKIYGLLLFFLFPPFATAELPPLKIGGIYALTGPLASYSEDYRNGALLAAEVSTASGFPVQLIVEDYKWEPKVAVSAYRKLADHDGVKIFHTNASGGVIAISPLSEKNNHLIVAAAAYLPRIEASKLLFRHANLTDRDARLIHSFILERGWNDVRVIAVENEWAKSYETNLRALASGIIKKTEWYAAEENDFRTLLLRLTAGAPDAVVTISAGAASGTIMKQLRELRYAGPIVANNGFDISKEGQEIARAAGVENIFAQVYADPPALFGDAYRKRFGSEPGALSIWAYTDIEMLAAMAKKVGADPHAIASEIRKLRQFQGKYHSVKLNGNGDFPEDTVMREWPAQ